MEDSDKLELEIEAVARNWFTRWFATICFFLGMGAAFWAFSAPNKPIDPDIEVKVRGLVCPSCAIGIKNGLKKTKLIKEGKNEFLVETSIDKKGKYGRLLGKLFRLHEAHDPSCEYCRKRDEIKSYNQILLDEGHATIYDGGKR